MTNPGAADLPMCTNPRNRLCGAGATSTDQGALPPKKEDVFAGAGRALAPHDEGPDHPVAPFVRFRLTLSAMAS